MRERAGEDQHGGFTTKQRCRCTLLILVVLCNLLVAEAGSVVAVECNFWTQKRRKVKVDSATAQTVACLLASPKNLGAGEQRNAEKHPPNDPKGTPHKPSRVVSGPKPLAMNLVSPDGIAIHPSSEQIYVSEEDASRVSMITGGKRVCVLDRSTPIRDYERNTSNTGQPVSSPEGLAFAANGDLYVVEDVPGGRLLKYRLNRQGTAVYGVEVYVPGPWQDFAWEGVAAGPHGELLLAGSSVESSFTSESVPGVFCGVILYRDQYSNWWLVLREMLASFSSVAFSRDGTKAAYTCEINGTIGWIDLQQKNLRFGASAVMAKHPESINVLPNGCLLVAEEEGNLVVVNPATGQFRRTEFTHGSFETALWDSYNSQVIVSEDATGRLLALPLEADSAGYDYAFDGAAFDPPRTPQYIPSECPSYLASVLAYGGVDFTREDAAPVTFSTFANRVPMVSVDAKATPLGETVPHEASITDIKFVVFNPNSIQASDEGFNMSLSVFMAKTASGEMIVTKPWKGRGIRMDLATLDTTLPKNVSLQTPYPGVINVDDKGISNIHFLGLGEGPDIHVILNPQEPELSYILVDRIDGGREQYSLSAPAGGNLRDHMVISYSKELHSPWQFLGSDVLPEKAITGLGEPQETHHES